jgi:hypothetical protein
MLALIKQPHRLAVFNATGRPSPSLDPFHK